MDTATRYRRNRKGTTFHLAICPRAENAVPWLWAENKSLLELRMAFFEFPWLMPCKICDPLQTRSVWEDC